MRLTQVTRTSERESDPFFLIDESQVAYRRGNGAFVRDLDGDLEHQPIDVKAEKDPEEKEDDEGYVDEQQERLFEIIRKRGRDEKEGREREESLVEADPSRASRSWFLGDKITIEGMDLSPTGKAMLVRTSPKDHEKGKKDSMPEWVTEGGYVENKEVRELVGTFHSAPHKVILLRTGPREKISIDLSSLPMLDDDPLADLRAAAAERKKARKDEGADDSTPEEESEEKEEKEKGEENEEEHKRTVSTFQVRWSHDGSRVAFFARSTDNKDHWLYVVDAETGDLTVAEHLRDEAWINWRHNDYGWMPDGKRLWLLSERAGWSHLYLASPDGSTPTPLTSGEWEVRDVTPAHDGSAFFVTAGREHPGSDDLYLVRTAGGAMTRLSSSSGRRSFVIDPRERRVAFLHSTPTSPPEIYLQDLKAGRAARRLTETTTEEFRSIEWTMPEIVAIPSTHVERHIHTRVYDPPEGAPGKGPDGRRPAVMFVHGAGYLQNAHLGWSGYFREFMFHSLLTRLGYVVIDMDYRASAGYGRDWRTAIYRRMGTPELEDFQDGVAWLVRNRNVDPDRVGIYGGSYGGFMTFMALFRAPDLFACGAALRPVTDWAHYNHGYTSSILNTPDIDPEAYERSSPIEFAEGLKAPLLICHGMIDDNVFFKDTVRLAQRLIELEKENWEVAIYPIEPHGFREPPSWLDEYRRILKLFRTHLGADGPGS